MTFELSCKDEMRVGQKNKLTYRWARKGSRPRAAHDQRTQSTYLFGAVCPERGAGAALVLPACNTEAMQLTSMRSQPKSLRALTLFSSPIKPGGMAPRPSRFQTTFRSCSFRRAHPKSTPKKYLAIHAAELAVEPNFQILRRYRRPLLLRLEHTHRPALEDHVHRPTRLGSSRSLKLRIGISSARDARAARLRRLSHFVLAESGGFSVRARRQRAQATSESPPMTRR